jgi:hypothetical protein
MRLARESGDADRKFFIQTADAIEAVGDASGESAGATREWTRAQIDGLQVLRDGIGLVQDYEEAQRGAASATSEYAARQADLVQQLEDLRPAIDAAKNEILGVNESLGLAGGRAAFEIFVDASQAQADIEAFNSSLDGLEDSYKTEIELDADQASEEAAALAEELKKSADQFEAIVTSNAAEELTPAEQLNLEYDKAERAIATHFESNADEVLEIQVTPLQDAYGEVPEEIVTEFQTPGAEDAIERTIRLASKLGELPSQKTINIDVKVNQTGSVNVPGVDIPGFQSGGRFIVPPGIVRTPQEQRRADTVQQQAEPEAGAVQQNINIFNQTREAAALTMAMVQERKRRRLDRTMGI